MGGGGSRSLSRKIQRSRHRRAVPAAFANKHGDRSGNLAEYDRIRDFILFTVPFQLRNRLITAARRRNKFEEWPWLRTIITWLPSTHLTNAQTSNSSILNPINA